MACDAVSFEVARGTVHAFLGPNGSGKSTLFKILSTAYPLQSGEVTIFGLDLARDVRLVRPTLGVVFQSPALDVKLSVRENLVHGGHLYGMSGATLEARIDETLHQAGLADRGKDRVADLSGGLRRRTELAKGLLPKPRLLLLDEPSTGLDPGARIDLWRFLRSLDQLTVLCTTHLMDEAEDADRVTILRDGRVVADGTPPDLVREIGGLVLELTCADPQALGPRVAERFGVTPQVVDRALRIERDGAHELVAPLMEFLGDEVGRVSLSHPSLEDVYIRKTGHRFWVGDPEN
ncbi:MAG: ATP-binding cassette domain-containing protein [Planctomycetota bacterium]